jgi:hypothetical protein
MAKKKESEQGQDPRQELLKELRGLIREIESEGLLFLIKQANTLIYNQRVERLNRESDLKRREQPEKKEPPVVEQGEIRIERGAFGRSFILDIRSMRKTFAEAEMLGLVKAVRAASEEDDGAARIYRWLKRNRDDVLLDTGIMGPRDHILRALWSVLGSTFAVREE